MLSFEKQNSLLFALCLFTVYLSVPILCILLAAFREGCVDGSLRLTCHTLQSFISFTYFAWVKSEALIY